MQPRTFDNKDHLYLFDIPDHSVQCIGRPKFLRGEKSSENRRRQINDECQSDTVHVLRSELVCVNPTVLYNSSSLGMVRK